MLMLKKKIFTNGFFNIIIILRHKKRVTIQQVHMLEKQNFIIFLYILYTTRPKYYIFFNKVISLCFFLFMAPQ